MALPDRLQALGVLDGGLDLEAIADDAGISHQAPALARAEGGHLIDVEFSVSVSEGRPLLQAGEPGEPRLVDFEHEALEQDVVGAGRESVFPLVIGPVQGMAGGDLAVAAHRMQSVWGKPLARNVSCGS